MVGTRGNVIFNRSGSSHSVELCIWPGPLRQGPSMINQFTLGTIGIFLGRGFDQSELRVKMEI